MVVAHAKKTASSPEGLEPDVKVGEYLKETFSEIKYYTSTSETSSSETTRWHAYGNMHWETPKPELLTGLTPAKVDKLTNDELRVGAVRCRSRARRRLSRSV